MIKIDGKIMPVNQVELTPKMVRQAALELMDEEQLEAFTRDLEVDFAVSEPGLGRFRVNVFHQRGNVAMVLRFITPDLPNLDDLGMPEKLKDLVMLRRGLILMVGASGSGKSTTLAAMIDHRNRNSASHIVTIEDPIEFLHPNKEVHRQSAGSGAGYALLCARAAQRDAGSAGCGPDRRDPRPRDHAGGIDLAGTGHLAIATLHANNSPETLDRIVNMYPNDQHKQIMMDLSQYLRAIISQRLVRTREGKRAPRWS
jgi:twitching motility protein PilU